MTTQHAGPTALAVALAQFKKIHPGASAKAVRDAARRVAAAAIADGDAPEEVGEEVFKAFRPLVRAEDSWRTLDLALPILGEHGVPITEDAARAVVIGSGATLRNVNRYVVGVMAAAEAALRSARSTDDAVAAVRLRRRAYVLRHAAYQMEELADRDIDPFDPRQAEPDGWVNARAALLGFAHDHTAEVCASGDCNSGEERILQDALYQGEASWTSAVLTALSGELHEEGHIAAAALALRHAVFILSGWRRLLEDRDAYPHLERMLQMAVSRRHHEVGLVFEKAFQETEITLPEVFVPLVATLAEMGGRARGVGDVPPPPPVAPSVEGGIVADSLFVPDGATDLSEVIVQDAYGTGGFDGYVTARMVAGRLVFEAHPHEEYVARNWVATVETLPDVEDGVFGTAYYASATPS